MNITAASAPNFPLLPSLPSFLKPQVRWIPKIAEYAAGLGTAALLGITGWQAYATGAHSFADASLIQNALFVLPPTLAVRFNSRAAGNLSTWALWKPIRKETLKDPGEALNSAVLGSKPAQDAVETAAPGSMNVYTAHYNSLKNQALANGVVSAIVGGAMTLYFMNQFG